MGKKSRLMVAAAAAAVGLSSTAVVRGVTFTTYTWQPTAAGTYDWTNTGNWNPNTAYPNNSTSYADFTAGITGNQQVNLDQAETAYYVFVGSTTAGGDTGGYTIGGDGGNVLNFVGGGTAADPTTTSGGIVVNVGSVGDTIAAPIIVTDAASGADDPFGITNKSTGTLTISGAITVQGGSSFNRVEFNPNGAGGNAASTLVLSGAGSQVGALYDIAGTLDIANGASVNVTKDTSNCMTIGLVGGTATTVNVAGTLTTPNTSGTVTMYNGTLNINATGTMTTANNAGQPGINMANQSGSTAATINVNGGTLGNSSSLGNSYVLSLSGGGSATVATTVNVNVNSGSVYVTSIIDNPHNDASNVSNITQTGGTVEIGGEPYASGNGGQAIWQGNYNNAAGAHGIATITISGGNFDILPTPLQDTPWMLYPNAVANVQGTASVNLSTDAYVSINGGTFNLSGGRLTTPLIAGQSNFNAGTSITNWTLGAFNFSGGTLAMYDPNNAGTSIMNAGGPTFTNGGGALAVGGVGTTGATTITGNFAQTAGTLAVDLGGTTQGASASGYDELAVTGTAALGGGLSVNVLNGFMPANGDVYTFLTSGGLSGSFSNVAVGAQIAVTGGASGSFTLGQSGNNLILENYVGNLQWTGASTNAWNTSDVNWTSVQSTTYSDGDNVTLNDTNNGNYAITVNTTVSPGSVTVNNSNGNYTIGGTGSIAGTGALAKSGSGKLTLNTVNTYSGGTNVSAGTLVVGVNGALPSAAVSITGGTLQLAPSTGGASITSLAISGTGTFDIGNNHLVINYGAGPDPIASIQAMLSSGYNGGAWNGLGINSSAVASNPGYGVGYADSADAGNPAGLASGTIEVAFTLLGDVNLDHTVNGVDFGILAANFNKGITGWDNGDFNYDNSVNGVDFGALAANFNLGAASASDIAALDAFAAANGLLADVPEPASLGLLTLGGAGILARRRTRRKI